MVRFSTMSAQPSGGKSLGLAACTAIVVGNMVGSGFYLSPTAVAPYGNLAILAWLVMGAGAICLGLTFARLAPATGGPYAYTRMAYGESFVVEIQASAAYDVRLSWIRVRHGSSRRCGRRRTHHPAFDRPRHHDRSP
jgi:hypothetical protein